MICSVCDSASLNIECYSSCGLFLLTTVALGVQQQDDLLYTVGHVIERQDPNIVRSGSSMLPPSPPVAPEPPLCTTTRLQRLWPPEHGGVAPVKFGQRSRYT